MIFGLTGKRLHEAACSDLPPAIHLNYLSAGTWFDAVVKEAIMGGFAWW